MPALELRAAALACALLLVAQCAAAQAIDDAWVIDRVLTGKFDELRVLEAEAQKGSPVAMYWWGSFLRGCVYGRCDEKSAKALWLEAAAAGHSRAKIAAMRSASSLAELDRVVAKIGVPVGWEERVEYSGMRVGLSLPGPSGPDTWGEARAILRDIAASEPLLIVIFRLAVLDGLEKHVEDLRAVVAADHPAGAETFLRALLASERARFPELLAKAKSGDVAVAVAVCETVNFAQGIERLSTDLLSVCEKALSRGYLGIAPTLLRHHRVSGNAKAAAFYAELCATTGLTCVAELADYYYQVSGKSEAWKLWDAVGGSYAQAFTAATLRDFGLSAQVMQEVLRIHLRDSIAERACLSRLYDRAAKKFADDPACPYLKPIAIPAEFLGGRG